jgi:hypothetical protein
MFGILLGSSLEMSGNTKQAKQHHIPEDLNGQKIIIINFFLFFFILLLRPLMQL